MYFSFLATLFLALQVSGAPILQSILHPQQQSADSIVSKLKDAEVIPDVLSSSFSPSFSLSLVYSSHHTSVDLGNTIPVDSTSDRPVFQLTPLSSPDTLSPTRTLAANKTYTLVLSDPDATARADPVKGQMCHWIATGIKLVGTNATEGLEQGEELSGGGGLELRSVAMHDGEGKEDAETMKVEDLIEYMQPAPPPKTGKHRYVFVLLEPDKDGEGKGKQELKKPKDRPHFGYGNVGQGVLDWAKDNGLKPVGANFFYAKNKKQ